MGGSFTPKATQDGSFTFFSDTFGEAFHSDFGARQEAETKFIQPTQLEQKAGRSSVAILDVCYGLGYNTAAALEAIWQVNPACRVQWMGLELDQSVPKAAIAHHLLHQWSDPIPHLLQQLADTGQVQSDRLHATLWVGDARQTIRSVQQAGFRADAIFLDPFSPPRCPQLWTVEFVRELARCLQPDGRLATYSSAASVRAALLVNQFCISSTYGAGRRSPGTIATLQPDALPPLSQRQWEHLHTRAAVPYRDPSLGDTAAAILERHCRDQSLSSLEPTSRWKRRWSKSVSQAR
ncbi:MAG: hypothetical protein HC881_12035 [Leptolyngbyaceae cyanobacterium SL_7_1]|nr:hypothetical protein [Leptolyngbyaceae cyanobacterium SL_7_1]